MSRIKTKSYRQLLEKRSELLMVLNDSEQRLKEEYGDAEIPNLLGYFQKAREKLKAIIGE